jgi:hypothetical protein
MTTTLKDDMDPKVLKEVLADDVFETDHNECVPIYAGPISTEVCPPIPTPMQDLMDEIETLAGKKDEDSLARLKAIDQELHEILHPPEKTFEENKAVLAECIEDLDVPEARRQLRPMDIRWLNRNIHFNNGRKNLTRPRALIQKMLIQLDRGEQ